MLCITASNLSGAEPFAPTLLKIEAPPFIDYRFDGRPLEIPVLVSGTPCQLIFCIFTKGLADGVRQVRNGYLGWHYVNNIDTCVYFSAPFQFDPGANAVTWDAKNNDGDSISEIRLLTYYMWAFDNKSEKQLAYHHFDTINMTPWITSIGIQEVDENGLPLAHPFVYTSTTRFPLGYDNDDESLIEETILDGVFKTGWSRIGFPLIDPHDFNDIYTAVSNQDARKASIQKYRFIPGGSAEIDTLWGGEAPYATIYETSGGNSPGITSDRNRNYLYTVDDNHVSSNDPDADFHIYNYNGNLITEIDLTDWWSNPDDAAGDTIMNGGPTYLSSRGDFIFLGGHASCLKQMVNPQAYLTTGDQRDFLVWSNGNGDYTLDKNFEETATYSWICNDYNVPPYSYSIYSDENLFSVSPAGEIGKQSFGLLAPDGTGLGYFAFANEMSYKSGVFVIDSQTAIDGLYMDNTSWILPNTKYPAGYAEKLKGIYYIGHDSISGRLGIPPDCFGTSVIAVRSPESGDRLVQNKLTAIKWNPCSIRTARIEFTSDGGSSWSVIAERVDISKYFYWYVPSVISDSCMIRISNADNTDISAKSGIFSIVSGDAIIDESQLYTFTLSQNSPNPFNPLTSIPFTLPKESRVTLIIYNIAGKKIAMLIDGTLGAGSHSVDWDASNVASGVYFYLMKAGGFVETRKMMLVK